MQLFLKLGQFMSWQLLVGQNTFSLHFYHFVTLPKTKKIFYVINMSTRSGEAIRSCIWNDLGAHKLQLMWGVAGEVVQGNSLCFHRSCCAGSAALPYLIPNKYWHESDHQNSSVDLFNVLVVVCCTSVCADISVFAKLESHSFNVCNNIWDIYWNLPTTMTMWTVIQQIFIV